MAETINVSASLLSQIERNLANPSLSTLRAISEALDVPMFSLFIDEEKNETEIVRFKDRVRIASGKSVSDDIDLGYDLLSPDLKGDIQMCEMDLGPYKLSSDSLHTHDAEEVAVCTQGQIELQLSNTNILLDTGDSVRLAPKTLHRWRNPNSESCAIIFAMTPPVF